MWFLSGGWSPQYAFLAILVLLVAGLALAVPRLIAQPPPRRRFGPGATAIWQSFGSVRWTVWGITGFTLEGGRFGPVNTGRLDICAEGLRLGPNGFLARWQNPIWELPWTDVSSLIIGSDRCGFTVAGSDGALTFVPIEVSAIAKIAAECEAHSVPIRRVSSAAVGPDRSDPPGSGP